METIGFIGHPSRDKSYLMMYLAKVLSVSKKVIMVTDRQRFIKALAVFEYNDNFTIQSEQPEGVSCDFLLMDVVEEGHMTFDSCYLVSRPYRKEVEWNKALFESVVHETPKVIYQQVVMDGKIDAKYLNDRLNIDQKKVKIHTQYLDDLDIAAHMENEYGDSLVIKHLSKSYKKLIETLVDEMDDSKSKIHRQWFRKAERSK